MGPLERSAPAESTNALPTVCSQSRFRQYSDQGSHDNLSARLPPSFVAQQRMLTALVAGERPRRLGGGASWAVTGRARHARI